MGRRYGFVNVGNRLETLFSTLGVWTRARAEVLDRQVSRELVGTDRERRTTAAALVELDSYGLCLRNSNTITHDNVGEG